MQFEYKRYMLPSGDAIARPVIPILIRNPRNNQAIDYEALVDSGSDRCVFPSEIGEMIGIEIQAGQQEYVTGVVEGERRPLCMHPVEITPGGYSASRILRLLAALTDYDTGYTLEETAARLQKKAHRHVSPSTITSWLDAYKAHTSYRRLRAVGLKRFPANQTIRSIKLYHRQVYGFAYHRPKLEFVRTGSLDDKRAGDKHFASLADFLESIPTTCPHELFTRDDDPKARASQATPAWADASRIIVNRKENAATHTAALIIPSVGNNKLRHETLQRFMLANDSVTVAIEIPIWLTETDIVALEKQHGIELAPRVGPAERTITGHIDFLQIRNGCVHVLDYKPDARTNKPIAQLAIYALALTRLVPGLKLFDIKCAWFNEEEYCEIFPRTLFTSDRSLRP